MKNKFYENFVDKVTNAHYILFKVNEIVDITAPFSQLIWLWNGKCTQIALAIKLSMLLQIDSIDVSYPFIAWG